MTPGLSDTSIVCGRPAHYRCVRKARSHLLPRTRSFRARDTSEAFSVFPPCFGGGGPWVPVPPHPPTQFSLSQSFTLLSLRRYFGAVSGQSVQPSQQQKRRGDIEDIRFNGKRKKLRTRL